MFENTPAGTASVPPTNLPTEPDDMFSTVEPAAIPTAPPNALAAGLLKPKATSVTTMPQINSIPDLPAPEASLAIGATRAPGVGKLILAVAILVVVGGLGFVGFRMYRVATKKVIFTEQFILPPSSAPAVAEPNTNEVVANNNNQAPVAVPVPVPSPDTIPPAPATSTDTLSKTKNDQILFGEQIDSDKEGVSDSDEMTLYRTDPHNQDTDGDGLTDGEEILVWRTNPLKPDTDGDGLTDGDEVALWHTNPINPDSDSDGYVDGKEVSNGFNPAGPGKLEKFPAGMSTSTYNAKYRKQ
ncbi:MAG: hypothetical protein EXS55_04920 [Candidatus Magasanikbacteria bacterium]|nr:hypothetical protein [Candidatus Magasanikbacteria bacterium]